MVTASAVMVLESPKSGEPISGNAVLSSSLDYTVTLPAGGVEGRYCLIRFRRWKPISGIPEISLHYCQREVSRWDNSFPDRL